MEPTRRLKYVPDPNKFDLRTHVWDSQGMLVEKNTYRLHNKDGVNYFERPVNSGNLWYENNQPAGRVEYEFGKDGKISSKKLDIGADHKEFTAPLTGDEKLHFELEQERSRNAQLAAELAAIKKEAEAKASPASAEAQSEKPKPTLTKPEAKK